MIFKRTIWSIALCFLGTICTVYSANEWDKLDQWIKDGTAAELTVENNTATLLGSGGKSYAEAVSPRQVQKIQVPMQLSVKGEFSSKDIVAGYLLVTGFSAKGKATLWKSVCPLPANMEWTEKSFVVLIPPEVVTTRFHIRITSGSGSISFRNIQSAMVSLDKPIPGLELLQTVWLGTKNEEMPQNWQVKPWSANEGTYLVTPTQSGVELLSKAGDMRFGIEPTLFTETLPAGTALQLSAKFRTSGYGKAALMVEFFGKDGSKLGEELSKSDASSSWKTLSFDFKIPADTEKICPYLLNVGKGGVTYLESSLKTISSKSDAI